MAHGQSIYISPLYSFCTYFNIYNISYAIPTSIIIPNSHGWPSSCRQKPNRMDTMHGNDADAALRLKWQCDMLWLESPWFWGSRTWKCSAGLCLHPFQNKTWNISILGLFTVAIFEWFSAHFWLHFWIIFDVWQKNNHKMKPKMKPKKLPWTLWNANILKMKQKCILHHLQQCWQVLAHPNSPSKDLVKLFSQVCQSLRTSLMLSSTWILILKSYCSEVVNPYIIIFCCTDKNRYWYT